MCACFLLFGVFMFLGVNRAVQSVLGTIISHPELIDYAKVKFKPSDLYDPALKSIYKALLELDELKIGVDRATVESRLDAHITDEIWTMVTRSNDFSMFEDHLHVIGDDLLKRKLVRICQETISSQIDNKSVPADILLAKHHSEINILGGESVSDDGAQSYSELIPDLLSDMKERIISGDKLTGLSTGYDDLDEYTSGFVGGDLIIVAARPSMGKTAISMNMAEAMAKEGGRVLVFSMEMPKKQLLARSVASIGSIELGHLKSGQLSELEAGQLNNAIEKLNNYEILIDDTGSLTSSQLRLRSLKAHREKPLSAIYVDYLQLMSAADTKADKKADQIGYISRQLKLLAKELNVPIIALSQLNRELEKRADKRPINSDLRDSGAIEQDADIILFVYRDEVYNEDSPDKGFAELIIGKQRNGALGTVRLKFEGRYARFKNIPKITKVAEMNDLGLGFASNNQGYQHVNGDEEYVM
jgi:replicative DNA helicase